MTRKPILFLTMLAMLTNCRAPSTEPSITITAAALHPVNDHLFGHFMEKCSWGGEIGGDLVINPETGTFDPSVLGHLKSLNIPNLRYPGGTDVDYYSWTELIDHAPGQTRRKPYRQYRQGPDGKIVSDNRLGLNEFLDLCEQLEAEPILVLNIGDAYHGKERIEAAAASAANLYAYCNLPVSSGNPWAAFRAKNGRHAPYNVKLFEIGNEYWGFEGFQWKTGYAGKGLVEHLFQCVKAVADTLKALDSDNAIIADGALPELNRLFSQHLGKKIDYLVFHPYRPWAMDNIFLGDSTPADCDTITEREVWNAWVAMPDIDPVTGTARIFSDRWTDAVLESDFPIAATEWNWNGWFTGAPGKAGLTEPDLAKGIGAAGFLHGLMRLGDRVEIACQSMTVGQSWGITGIRVDPDYEQSPVMLPSAQVTGLYSNHHGNTLLQLETNRIPVYEQPLSMGLIEPVESVAVLDILATRSSDHLFIHAINRSYDKDYRLPVNLEGLTATGTGVRYTLSGDKQAEISNDELVQAADISSSEFKTGRKLTIEIPEASVSVFKIPLE